MSKRRLLVVLVCAAVTAAATCGDDKATTSPAPKYPATADGLKKMMEDVLAAAKSDDTKLTEMVAAMPLPQPEAWFKKVFDDETAARLVKEYQTMLGKDFTKQGKELFKGCLQQERTQVGITEIKDANDQAATGLQSDAIKAMKNPVPLYAVRFTKAGETLGTALWSFVWTDDAWRLVGKMRMVKPAQ